MIRPQPARWFEVVCARDDAFVLLEALAARGCAQIEWHAGGDERQAELANRHLKAFAALARRYRAYWPPARLREATHLQAPMAAFEAALASLDAWAAGSAAAVATLQDCERELAELAVVARVLDALDESAIDLGQLADASGPIAARVLVYPPGTEAAIPPEVLVHRFTAAHEPHAVVVGAAGAIAALEREAVALRGRVIAFPPWLARDARASRAALDARVAALTREAQGLRAGLEASLERHGVALALGDIARSAWCFQNVGAVGGTTGLARITGWTDDAARLAAAVEACGARALASFPAAPAGAMAPLLLRNPWWARPFELFIRLFGVPGREGADPSVLLAIASPLLFGYMFGDVGQGLVLLVAGVALRRRYPALRLLIPGGLAAIGFGFAFGSVFAREDLVAHLWVAPLEQPLLVLVVPLFAGAVLLTLGLALHALEAHWRGALGEWVRCEAGLVLVYLGLLLAPFHAAGFAVAGAGAAAFVGGRAAHARRLGAALPALGALAERTLQILVNTVSFARVGAFALAHCGLSAAVVALGEATGSPVGALAVLVAGNVVILVLEGLVVGIQTTRLILFEFFVRFLESRGREFRPLLPPNVTEVHP